MTNQIPTELDDWVSLRAACNVGSLFEQLKSGVEKDIAARQDAIHKQSQLKLGINYSSSRFTVLLDGRYQGDPTGGTVVVHNAVVFTLDQHKIIVQDEERAVTYEATATLCDDGKCRLSVNGQELELWQFRKRTLESLLFSKYLP